MRGRYRLWVGGTYCGDGVKAAEGRYTPPARRTVVIPWRRLRPRAPIRICLRTSSGTLIDAVVASTPPRKGSQGSRGNGGLQQLWRTYPLRSRDSKTSDGRDAIGFSARPSPIPVNVAAAMLALALVLLAIGALPIAVAARIRIPRGFQHYREDMTFIGLACAGCAGLILLIVWMSG